MVSERRWNWHWNSLHPRPNGTGYFWGINKAAVRVDVPDENITDVIGNVRLQINGQYYDAEPYGLLANDVSEIGLDGSYAWYVFDLNNEVELSDDEEVQVNVEVGFDAQEGAYPRFQTASVQVDEETRSLWESEGYDDLSPTLDYFGLALGETHQVVPPSLIVGDYQTDTNTYGRYPKIKTPFLSYLMIPHTAL